MSTMWRSRWAAVGAAVAITLGAGGIGIVDATKSSGERAVYTAIEPCRLLDTRPNEGIGGRTAPLGPGEVYDLTAHGDNGQCTGIPNDTVALELNVTGLFNTGATHFTIWSGAGAVPNASHVNLAPGASPTPNSVTTELDGAGFAIRNNSATSHVIIDIVGVYQDHNHDDRYYTETEVDDKTWGSTSLTNEAGVAVSNRTSSFDLTGPPELVSSAFMRVPSDGYVTVSVSGIWYAGNAAGSDYGYCDVQIGTTNSVSPTANPGWVIFNDRGATTNGWDGFSLTTTLEIAVADNPFAFNFGQAINLVCDQVQGDITLDDVVISALFTPTNYEPVGIVFPFPDEAPLAPGMVDPMNP
ncbi:hypothetical protein BDK89_2507 [Ilumatobacter fluminis]|uniref:Uncharacterized protein n=1 Tax=Ilumatobacter fluminis TaxID=467091 RepID=A0A4R7I2P1_9ACTN|nr:hypothetical protein [Ilumatobacter fluminis]TDT16906.1 hypothetical protein BDK89_2507 [Ilumatobacter fluminis]